MQITSPASGSGGQPYRYAATCRAAQDRLAPVRERRGDYTLPLARKGRAYADLYREHLRPALKRTWQHPPIGMRAPLAALFVAI